MMRDWLIRLTSLALPVAWRANIVRDLEDEARMRARGTWWLLVEIARVAFHFRVAIGADTLVADIRYVARSLLRGKGFTSAAILTFTLGVGVNIAVFSVFDRLMFRPLPYAAPDRLVHLHQVTLPAHGGLPASSNIMGEVSLALATYGRAFTGVAWAQGGGLRTSPGPEAPPLTLTIATRNLLDVLGIQPEFGRPFRDEDVADRGARSVMLTHEAWQRWFGGSEDVLAVTWGTRPSYRIVGVLPPGFLLPSSRFMEECDGIFVAPTTAPELNAIPGAVAVGAVARLRPGVTIAEAEADAARVMASVDDWGSPELLRAITQGAGNERVIVTPLRAGLSRLVRPYLWMISIGVWVLLLVACVNLATLLLARGRSRERDVAIRTSLGASPARVLRVAVLESVILCSASSALALLACAWVRPFVLAVVPNEFRGFAVAPFDTRVLTITLVVSLGAAVVAAISPAITAVRVDLLSTLRATGPARVCSTLRGGSLFLGGQAALGAALVVGATVSVPAFLSLVYGFHGYRPEDLYQLAVNHGDVDGTLDRDTYYANELATRSARVALVLDTLEDVPHVRGAAVSLPLVNGRAFWQARNAAGNGTGIDERWLDTMGASFLAGRSFTRDEVTANAPLAVLNVSAAKALWPGEPVVSAVGRSLPTTDGLRTVVGLVEDLRLEPERPSGAMLYLPLMSPTARQSSSGLPVTVRMEAGFTPDTKVIEARLNQHFPRNRVFARSIEAEIAPAFRRPRFLATLFGTIASVALVLAGLGLYAVTSFEMLRRRHEMGVRLALGGSRQDVARRLFLVALRPVAVGTAVGLTAAWWVASAVQALVVGASPRAPVYYVAAGILMLGTALIAAWRPARRAARLDPAAVLRAL